MDKSKLIKFDIKEKVEIKKDILTAFCSFLPTDTDDDCNEDVLDGYVRCFEEVYTAAIIKDGNVNFMSEALERVKILLSTSMNADFKAGVKLFLKALFTFI